MSVALNERDLASGSASPVNDDSPVSRREMQTLIVQTVEAASREMQTLIVQTVEAAFRTRDTRVDAALRKRGYTAGHRKACNRALRMNFEMGMSKLQQPHFEFPSKPKTSVRGNSSSPNMSSSTALHQRNVDRQDQPITTQVSGDSFTDDDYHDLAYSIQVDPECVLDSEALDTCYLLSNTVEEAQNMLPNLNTGASPTVELSAENPTDPDLVQQQHMTSFSHTDFVSPTQENTAVAPIFNNVNNVLNMHLPTSVPAVSFSAVSSPPTELVRRDPNSSSPPTELVRREFNLLLPPRRRVRREWTGLAKFTYF